MDREARKLGAGDACVKILHVGVGNFDSGGVATYVRSIAAAQKALGHEVVLSEIWPKDQSLAEPAHRLSSLDSLIELQDKFRPAVTHLHSQLPDYARLKGPSVLTAHEHTAHCPSGGRYLQAKRVCCDRDFGILPCLWGHFIDRCGSRNPSAFWWRYSATVQSASFTGHWLAPSMFTAKWLKRRGLDPSRIHVVGNPQPEQGQPIENASPEPAVLFLGRLVQNKGCDVLLRAMALLPATASLWIAGEGPERAALEALARELGLESRVRFLGWMAPDRVRALLERSRVLAVPSLWPEPFGLVALEAYAAARPVVASAVGGLADLVVEGVTGRLVPPDDPAKLAAALAGYLTDLPASIRAGQAGRVHSHRNFSMETHMEKLDRVYSLAMERTA